ncbi:hypothetical protein AX15_007231 [Amanita polypyramis BW_CC]|nr:hypothetical protein AX15_007231 [Amanita polypyramis BW_CC]
MQAQSNPLPSDRTSEKPNAEQLVGLGIKVRDFAYESSLPPIAPVYFLPKQIQPDPRMTMPSQSPLLPLQLLHRLAPFPTGDSKKLGKKPTESTIRSSGVTRQRGFSDLRDYGPCSDDVPDSQDSSPSHSQPQPSLSYSQNCDEYVKTPVVTPNGSLQWQDAGTDDASLLKPDTSVPIRPLSYSQHEESPRKEELFATPSPLSPANSSFSMSPSPMPSSKPILHKHRALRRSPRPIRARQSLRSKDPVTSSPASASRYYLRKRPSRTSSNTLPIVRSCLGPSLPSKSKLSVSSSGPSSRPQEEVTEGPSLRTFRKRVTSSPRIKEEKRL